jgi:hypothetical protein
MFAKIVAALAWSLPAVRNVRMRSHRQPKSRWGGLRQCQFMGWVELGVSADCTARNEGNREFPKWMALNYDLAAGCAITAAALRNPQLPQRTGAERVPPGRRVENTASAALGVRVRAHPPSPGRYPSVVSCKECTGAKEAEMGYGQVACVEHPLTCHRRRTSTRYNH